MKFLKLAVHTVQVWNGWEGWKLLNDCQATRTGSVTSARSLPVSDSKPRRTQQISECLRLKRGLAAAFLAHPHQHLQPISSVRSANSTACCTKWSNELLSLLWFSSLALTRPLCKFFQLGFTFCPHLAVAAARPENGAMELKAKTKRSTFSFQF